PLWKRNTAQLATEMIAGGLKARVVCVDPGAVPGTLAGREFNDQFLADLSSSIDPCGENGEFHTFAYAGPMFDAPITFEAGETVERDGFLFADLKSPP